MNTVQCISLSRQDLINWILNSSKHLVAMKLLHLYVISYTSVLQLAINEAALSVLKWNKHLQQFETIYPVPSYADDQQKIILSNHQDQARSFQGEVLRLSYYQVVVNFLLNILVENTLNLTIYRFQSPDFFEFSDNDTKASGIYGDVWTTLADSLNFTYALELSNLFFPRLEDDCLTYFVKF